MVLYLIDVYNTIVSNKNLISKGVIAKATTFFLN